VQARVRVPVGVKGVIEGVVIQQTVPSKFIIQRL
jgi:hypothetical protein